MRLWFRIVVTLGLAAALVGIGVAIGRADDQEAVTRIVSSDGQETIVVRDAGPRLFPLWLVLAPLLFFLTLGLLCAVLGRRGGNRREGRGPEAPPGWVDDWHRRAHKGEAQAHVATER
jgi:hypothetical protein